MKYLFFASGLLSVILCTVDVYNHKHTYPEGSLGFLAMGIYFALDRIDDLKKEK